jgi:hypothetical protein
MNIYEYRSFYYLFFIKQKKNSNNFIDMQNPLLKNKKTWLFGDILDRTSHYNRILCAKSMYGSNDSPQK